MTRVLLMSSIAGSSLLLLTLATSAKASPAALAPIQSAQSEQTAVPTPDQQLAALTAKLDLTADQQVKIRPILAQLDDLQAKLVADSTLTEEERLEKIRPARFRTADQIRAVLTEDQKPKFEAYLAGPHPEMHGNLTGSHAPQQ